MHSPSLEAAHSIWECQVHVMLDRERHTGGSYARLIHAQSCWIICSKAACVCPLYLLCDLPCSATCLVHAVDDSGASTLLPLSKLCSVSAQFFFMFNRTAKAWSATCHSLCKTNVPRRFYLQVCATPVLPRRLVLSGA